MSSSKLCVVLGGVLVKQQYHYLHWWRNNTTCIVIACSPSLYHAPPSPFWLKCRCFQLPPRPTVEERSNRSVEGQIRCVRIAIELLADKAFGIEENIFVWHCRHFGLAHYVAHYEISRAD